MLRKVEGIFLNHREGQLPRDVTREPEGSPGRTRVEVNLRVTVKVSLSECIVADGGHGGA